MSFVTLAILILGGFQDAKTNADVRAELEHIMVAYKANQAAFPYGVFRFDYLRGSAANEEDARIGRLRPTPTARGYYAYDGTNARYEIVYEAQELESKTRPTGEDRYSSSLMSHRLLTDGQVTLLDQITPNMTTHELRHSAQIRPFDVFSQMCEFPLGLGNPHDTRCNLARDIERFLKGEIELKTYDPSQSFEGFVVAKIVFKMVAGERSYWVDMERGSIPLQVMDHVESRKDVTLYNLDDVRFEAGAGWLPRVMTTTLQGAKIVTRILLREIKLDQPPAKSVFQLDFPTEFRLYDEPKRRTYEPRKVWSLLDLPNPNSPQAHPVENLGFRPPTDQMPGERFAPFWTTRAIVLATLGAVFLGLAAFRVVLGRSRKTA